MKIFYKVTTILLILAGMIACGDEKKDNESLKQEFLIRLQSAPFEKVTAYESFPKWLLDKIEMIEKDSPNVIGVEIYKGEWTKQITYLVLSNLSSCLFCDTYYEDGSKVMLSNEKAINDFCLQSKNWIIVYKYGTIDYSPY